MPLTPGNQKKKDQLGVSPGTAYHRLRKKLMWLLAHKSNMGNCFQCGEAIETAAEISVEHKRPWLDSENPRKLFYDLDNVAFSHLSCNIGAARRHNKRYFTAEERRAAKNAQRRKSHKRNYCPKKRRERYLKTKK